MSKVPAVRFKGFTDPWEQRKLGELVADIATGKSVNSDDGALRSDDIGIMKTSCVSYDSFDASEAKRVVPEERALVACPVEANTLIVSRMNTPDRVGACGFVPASRPNLFLPDRLWRLRINEGFNPYLLYVILVSEDSKAKLKGMASGTSGSMHNIPKDSFLEMEVALPVSIAEQRMIASQFASLDNLITLHQRKHEQLTVLKKALLDKMFPKDGACVPEIRFSGFTDPWEQRKLGEVAEVKDSARISNALWTDTGVPYIRASDVTNDDMSGELFISQEVFDYYRGQTGAPGQGDMLFNGGGEIGKTHLLKTNAQVYVQGGAVLYVKTSESDSLDGEYLSAAFQSNGVRRYIDVASAGGTMKHFTLGPALRTPLAVPKLSEQKHIGGLFSRIDNLITLHRRKLEVLRNLKSALLEKMFV